jgi:hypothetical protein
MLFWQHKFNSAILHPCSALHQDIHHVRSCGDAACLRNVVVAAGALILPCERRQVENYNSTAGAIRSKGERAWMTTAASSFCVYASAILPARGMAVALQHRCVAAALLIVGAEMVYGPRTG